MLSWRVEVGVIWTFRKENKNIIFLYMCLWGIGLKSQFGQLNTVIYPFNSVWRKKNYDSLPADIVKWSEITSTAANQKRKTVLFLPKLHVSQVAFSTFLSLSLKLPLKNNSHNSLRKCDLSFPGHTSLQRDRGGHKTIIFLNFPHLLSLKPVFFKLCHRVEISQEVHNEHAINQPSRLPFWLLFCLS